MESNSNEIFITGRHPEPNYRYWVKNHLWLEEQFRIVTFNQNPEKSFIIVFFYWHTNQLHAVSRTLQGRQREPSVKTLRSLLSAEFWWHCVLSGRTPRLSSTPERRDGNINLSKYFISSSGDRIHNRSFYSHTSCRCATTGHKQMNIGSNKN